MVIIEMTPSTLQIGKHILYNKIAWLFTRRNEENIIRPSTITIKILLWDPKKFYLFLFIVSLTGYSTLFTDVEYHLRVSNK